VVAAGESGVEDVAAALQDVQGAVVVVVVAGGAGPERGAPDGAPLTLTTA